MNNCNIMLICHKLVVSNEAAVLQACHVSDVHATSAVWCCSVMLHNYMLIMPCQRRERLCAAERLIQSYLSLEQHQSAATPHHHNHWEMQLSYPRSKKWEENARRKQMQAHSCAWRHTWQSRQKFTVNRRRCKRWFLNLVPFFSYFVVNP